MKIGPMIVLTPLDFGWEATVSLKGIEGKSITMVKVHAVKKEEAYSLAKIQAVILFGQIVKLVVDQEL